MINPIPGDVDGIVVRHETCSLATVRRVAAMLDHDPDQWSEGDILPRGWQFILLGADTRRSALRPDGFPGLGVPLPDLGLPRLLLAGRTVHFAGDIRIGDDLRRESRVDKILNKETANGPMAIVSLSHEIRAAEAPEPVLMETQTYILLSAQSGSRRASESVPVTPPSTAKRVVPDDTLLFQYSALGFNSHRIHLDRDFARQAEGFPDLVVNGGLATLLLTEYLRTEFAVAPTSLVARHVAPLFCNRSILLGAEQRAGKWQLRALDDTNRLAVDIEVVT
jgi:3-methylfumaryl-CoA hydratase